MLPTTHQILGTIFLFFGLVGCDIKSNLPDLDYPSTTAYENAEWPELVPTAELTSSRVKIAEEDVVALSSLAERAQNLRVRASGLRPGGISAARIARLKQKAAALRAAKI